VIFFTGTSQKLEEYLSNYYLAHYNFGDYLIDESLDKPLFPKIKFILGEHPKREGITMIFNRDKTID